MLSIRKRRTVYARYFISYCCIALIPVIVVIVAFLLLTARTHENNAKDLYRRATTQTAAHLDATIQELQSSVTYFSIDSKISDLLTDSPYDVPELTAPITSYLTSVEQSCRLNAQVFFYPVGSTWLYTAQGPMHYQAFEEALVGYADLNRSSFFTQLNNTTSFSLRSLAAPEGNEDSPYVAALFPYYTSSGGQKGTFGYLIPKEDLLAIVSDYLGVQPDYLYLYSSKLELFSKHEALPQNAEVHSRMIRNTIQTISSLLLSGQHYHMMRYKTDLYGLQFVTAVRLDQLYGNFYRVQSTTLIFGSIVMIGILICAVLLARYSYRPIRALLDTIAPLDDSEEQGEEFDRIGNHLSQVQSEMLSLQEKLAMQRPLVRDRLLLRLLRGTISENGLQQFHGVFPDVRLDGSFFVVLIAASGKTLMHYQPLLEELPRDKGYGVYLEDEQLFAILFQCFEAENLRLSQCSQLMRQMQEIGISSARVSAGQSVQGYQKIPTSYLEAYIALNSRMQADDATNIFLYNPIVPGETFVNRPEGNDTDIYLQSVRSVDAKTALELLTTLLDRMKEDCASVLNASYVRFELYSKTLSLCENNVSQHFRAKAASIDVFSDEERFRQLMIELTQANCAAVEEKRDSQQSKSRQHILQLLQEHCFDPAFSLSRLSELVDYSTTHINRCLREETGLSFIQLVSNLRLARARQELVDTDDRIKDIIARCGYLDMASFSRKFKEVEGLTPGEYRDLHQKRTNS